MRYLILALPLLLAACSKPAEAPPAPAAATSAPASADDGWNGKYEGNLRVEVSGTPGAHKVSLLVATADCTGDIGLSDGGVDAQATAPDELSLVVEDNAPSICHVSLKRSGNTLTVSEDNCSDYHGAACSFNGTATRVK